MERMATLRRWLEAWIEGGAAMTQEPAPDDRGAEERGEEAAEWLSEWTAAARLAEAPADLAGRKALLQARIQGERGLSAWLRSRPTGMRRGVFAALVVLAAAAVTKRSDLHAYPLGYLLPGLLAFGGLALWAALAALRPLHRPAPDGWRSVLPLVAMLVAPVLFALLPEAYQTARAVSPVPAAQLPRAWQCFVFGTLAGAPFALVGWLLDRGGLAGHGRLLRVALAAALVGNLLLLLHCPNSAPLHLLAGHASVLLPPLAAVGLVLVRRLGRR